MTEIFTCPLCESASFSLSFIRSRACCFSKEVQPNPEYYPNTPEGDQDFMDDYWQGDYEAMIYHQDIGDR